jgi:alanine dehydrogenase
MDIDGKNGTMLFMPGYDPAEGMAALKIVSVFPDNRAKGLPAINGLVVALDPETGRASALLEGGTLTAIRTGAAAGAATDVLARPDATCAAVFGAGVQGRTQLEAVASVRSLESAWIYDLDETAAERYAEEMSGRLAIPVRVATSPAEALSHAHIISTVTTASSPIFDDADLRPGTHINAVGVFKLDRREIPAATVARSRVVVDSVSACEEEAGDLMLPLGEGVIRRDHFADELGEILAGKKAGRGSPEELTLFKSVGISAQDVLAAALAVRNAAKRGYGRELEL